MSSSTKFTTSLQDSGKVEWLNFTKLNIPTLSELGTEEDDEQANTVVDVYFSHNSSTHQITLMGDLLIDLLARVSNYEIRYLRPLNSTKAWLYDCLNTSNVAKIAILTCGNNLAVATTDMTSYINCKMIFGDMKSLVEIGRSILSNLSGEFPN